MQGEGTETLRPETAALSREIERGRIVERVRMVNRVNADSVVGQRELLRIELGFTKGCVVFGCGSTARGCVRGRFMAIRRVFGLLDR